MGINLTILEGLPQNLRTQLEDFVNQLGANLGVEHEDDGTHKSITGPGNLFKGGHGTFHGQLKCRVALTSGVNLTFPNANEVPVLWDQPMATDIATPDGLYDNGTMYSVAPIYQGPATGYFLPPEEGNYLFLASLRWPPGPGNSQYQIMVRSGLDEVAKTTVAGNSNVSVSTTVSAVVPFPPADTEPIIGALQRVPVQIVVFQTTGGVVSVSPTSSSSHCMVIKLS